MKTENLLRCLIGAALAIVAATADCHAQPVDSLQVKDNRLELTLIASEPDLVTPIGIAVDKQGRVFVAESNTHFPPANYAGPKTDLIKVFTPGENGKAGAPGIFASDLRWTMNLAFSPNGHLYAIHRNGMIRFEDKDGDAVSDSRQKLVNMNTSSTYPHDGLGSIAFSPDGEWVYFGEGENLGEKFELVGSDGTTLYGNGEGGYVYRCRLDGTKLERVASGFWNPFGLAFFGTEYLLAGDNDPDSRPPNRLVDVVNGGDYGYQFKYGRTGLHPFQAWNGELPGTLPMVAGVGEAVSGILPCSSAKLPPDYQNAVLVTSWGDHRIELYRPKPHGASLRAEREILVQGGDMFRPVAMAAAPDGSIFFTDWVDKSYPVHGHGRLWKLSVKTEAAKTAIKSPVTIKANAARQKMDRLLMADSASETATVTSGLGDEDPFIRSAAVLALARPVFREAMNAAAGDKYPLVRLGGLLAMRKAGISNSTPIIEKFLGDADEQVRIAALIWAAEGGQVSLKDRLGVTLTAGPVSPHLVRVHSAAVQSLTKAAGGTSVPVGTTVAGITVLRPNESGRMALEQQALKQLNSASDQSAPGVRIEAVRALEDTGGDEAMMALKQVAAKAGNPPELRAEALSILGGSHEEEMTPLLLNLLSADSEIVRTEAARSLRGRLTKPEETAAVEKRWESLRSSGKDSALAEQLEFLLHPPGTSGAPERPSTDDEWKQALKGPGDVASGRRVFFQPKVGCSKCHRIEDHGGQIGPDLSTIALAADRDKLIRSILHPSQDIAPQFVSHTVETKDDQSFSGILLAEETDGSVTLLNTDGSGVIIPGAKIASRSQSRVSMMPEGLQNSLTLQDFRDLLAFLLSRR